MGLVLCADAYMAALVRWFIEIFAKALASTLADMKKEGKL